MTRRLAAILSLDAVGFSARMAEDSGATVAALNRLLRETVRPAIRARRGRIVKLMGDGALAEFPSAADAILAAARILAEAPEDAPPLRAGIHAGDVTEEAGDLFGDAVNLAARLQAAAPPGGAYVSRLAADLAGGGLGVTLRSEGALKLRGAARPVEALSLDLAAAPDDRLARLSRSQEIRFAASADGVRLAWTLIGEGPLLVKAPNWIQHLERDWDSFIGPWLAALARNRRLLRFDSRGNGLSDWDVPEIGFDRFVDDLEAVLDAAGVERAPILGFSQGAAIAIGFAARRPERVSRLVCVGGFAQGFAHRDHREAERQAALRELGRADWHGRYPSVRDLFAELVAPDASREDRRVFAQAMRDIISPENFARFRAAVGDFDVTDLLGRVRCPALVLHARGDRLQPVEQSRRLASGLPDARFVALDSNNHLPPDYDPAFPVMMREIDAFLAADA